MKLLHRTKMNEFYRNKIFLAPMAGVTDLAFRTICKECGADLVVSEMISSRGLHYKDKKTVSLLKTNHIESPLIVQIFGNEPEIMAESAKILEDAGVKYLDINMGCPAPKIVKNGDGCSLMRDEVLAGRIVESVVKAVSVPVSVKCRSGWDDTCKNVVSFAKVMENSGAFAITVHGRTREQFYSGISDLSFIREVKNSVLIPVIGNGDITDGKKAKNLYDNTNCDSIMIGRGALGNPLIFYDIKRALNPQEINTVNLRDKRSIILRHIELMRETKPEHIGVAEMRKHIAWYLKGIPHSAKLKSKAFSAKTYKELQEMISII